MSSSKEKKTTHMLRTKGTLNVALSPILKGGKICAFHFPSLKVPILVRNDSLTSEKFKAKNRLYISYLYGMVNT